MVVRRTDLGEGYEYLIKPLRHCPDRRPRLIRIIAFKWLKLRVWLGIIR